MAETRIDFDLTRLQARLNELRGSFDDKNPDFRRALLRIGLLLENRIILNIRREHLIDTGRLLNSVRHEIREDKGVFTIIAGSFGVPYAPVHEFGGTFTVKSYVKRAHIRTQNGQPITVREHIVGTHTRYYEKRSFVKPAFEDSTADVLRILREVPK